MEAVMTASLFHRDRARRVIFVALGVACTGLAGLGVVVPGLPTTVFLIGASYLFARSSPRLEKRLRESRWFGSTLRRFAESGGAMPRRAKVVALLSMWAGIAGSVLALSGVAALQAATVALGLVGTATIVFRVPTSQAGIVRVHGGRALQEPSSIGALR
jgi:hypothetical protein